jgi:type IV secretory pathway VirB10-like protein
VADDYIPPFLQGAMRNLTNAVADLDTKLIRAWEMEVKDIPPTDPKALEAAAKRPDAPPHLKAVLKAVNEGRTTWEAVAQGKASHVPEVQAMLAASGPMMAAKMQQAEEELAAQEEAERRKADAAARRAKRGPAEDDDDYSNQTFMRKDW